MKKQNNSTSSSQESQNSDISLIPDTPFASVKIGDDIRIVVGNQIVTDLKFKTHTEARIYASKFSWDIVFNMTQFLINQLKNNKNENS